MGRYKRKKHKYATTRSSSNAGASSTFSQEAQGKHFSVKDKNLLLQYLQEYYDGSFRVYNGLKKHGVLESDEPIIIGGHTFPMLTDDVLQQPYLALPKKLSSKQRRVAHEICCDVGVFHCGVGPSRDDRIIAISIYRDGLSHVPNIESSKEPSVSFRKYKPWVCRKHAKDCMEVTQQARDEIYQFIDQPGACLRGDIDTIDVREMEAEDLSQTTPPGSDEEEWMLVDSREKMRQCIQELEEAKPTEIAFDLECYNKSNYTQMTCLLQLAINNGKEYVIDPLAPGVWESVGGLAPLFANPDIVKIGHSIGGLDVRCLHRDFGIFVVNAFDTYEAAQCLNLPSKGLAKVCGNYGLPDCEIYESLKEKYQTTDWTKRPLTKPMIQYGRYDVHYLIKIRRLMMRDLVKQELGDKSNKATKDAEAKQVATSLAAVLRRFDEDEETFDDDDDFATPTNVSFDEDEDEYEETEMQEEGEQRSFFDAKALRMNVDLMQAISRSQDRCLDLWNDNVEPHLKNSEFRSLVVRSKKGEIQWTSSQLELYEKLAQWRELVAAREECTGGCVCPLGLLANIALRRPTNEVGLQLLRSHLPDLLEDTSTNNNMNEVFQLVLESRQADGLEECDYSEIPRYEDYLARERMGYFVDRSVPSESIGGFSGLVAAGVVACVAAIAVTVVAASKRSR